MSEWQSALLAFDYMPHGYCYLWDTGLVRLHVISDAVIAISYYVIPIILFYFVRKRRDLPFNWMFVMFAVFILSCGTTHLMDVWTLWHANYWLSGWIKAVTAAASAATAALLLPLAPKALALPSPSQLAAANEKLQDEIAERMRVEEALEEKNRELEAANRAKDRFLASMSHELRTPLNAIIGFTGILLMGLPGTLNEEQRKQLQSVRLSAKHLLSLINDLLDLAKIESGEVTLIPAPVVCQ